MINQGKLLQGVTYRTERRKMDKSVDISKSDYSVVHMEGYGLNHLKQYFGKMMSTKFVKNSVYQISELENEILYLDGVSIEEQERMILSQRCCGIFLISNVEETPLYMNVMYGYNKMIRPCFGIMKVTSEGVLRDVDALIGLKDHDKIRVQVELGVTRMRVADFLRYIEAHDISGICVMASEKQLLRFDKTIIFDLLLYRFAIYLYIRSVSSIEDKLNVLEDTTVDIKKDVVNMAQVTIMHSLIYVPATTCIFKEQRQPVSLGFIGDSPDNMLLQKFDSFTAMHAYNLSANALHRVVDVITLDYLKQRTGITMEFKSFKKSGELKGEVFITETSHIVSKNLQALTRFQRLGSKPTKYVENFESQFKDVVVQDIPFALLLNSKKTWAVATFKKVMLMDMLDYGFEIPNDRYVDVLIPLVGYKMNKNDYHIRYEVNLLIDNLLQYNAVTMPEVKVSVKRKGRHRVIDLQSGVERGVGSELTSNLSLPVQNILLSIRDGVSKPCLNVPIDLDHTNKLDGDEIIVFKTLAFDAIKDGFHIRDNRVSNINHMLNELIRDSSMKLEWWVWYRNEFIELRMTTELEISMEPFNCQVMLLPTSFVGSTLNHALVADEVYTILENLVVQGVVNSIEIASIRTWVSDLSNTVELLVHGLNRLQEAFNELQRKLEESSKVPWWKTALMALAAIGGMVATILFPVSLPWAIGLMVASTSVQVGLMFAGGDFVGGSVQMVGMILGVGLGYYQFRKASNATYPFAKLKNTSVEKQMIPDGVPKDIMSGDGFWVESRPLNVLGPRGEKLGLQLLKSDSIIHKALMRVDNSPTHARLHSVTTKVVDGEIFRYHVISGVTEGLPQVSHINPRPGGFEFVEKYNLTTKTFEPGWHTGMLDMTTPFDSLPRTMKGLLYEGSTNNLDYANIKRAWNIGSLDERAHLLNSAQQEVGMMNAGKYFMNKSTRVSTSMDPSLIKNVSQIFEKHMGLYEFSGLTAPGGTNNCQTYAKELRDFLAKGAISVKKVNNTSFLNDLFTAIDTSVEFDAHMRPFLGK